MRHTRHQQFSFLPRPPEQKKHRGRAVNRMIKDPEKNFRIIEDIDGFVLNSIFCPPEHKIKMLHELIGLR
jgi:hypothetical protein